MILENQEPVEQFRCSGRTTRLVDEAIQNLFTKKITIVKDHYLHRNADRMLLAKICSRLHNEHPHVNYEVKNINNEKHIMII